MVQAVSLGVQRLAAAGIEEPEIHRIWEESVFRILGISDAKTDAPFISPPSLEKRVVEGAVRLLRPPECGNPRTPAGRVGYACPERRLP